MEKQESQQFDREQFATRLYTAKERAGFSKNTDLAAACGASASSIGYYLNQKRTPRGLDDLIPIAKALNVSIDFLCGLSDDPKPSKRFQLETYFDVYKALHKLSLSFENGTTIVKGDNVILTLKDAKLAGFISRVHKVIDLGGVISFSRVFDLLGDIEEEMRNEPLTNEAAERPVK